MFPDPPHMQYDVYNILSTWWMSKKKQLKKELEVEGARASRTHAWPLLVRSL